MSQVSTETPEQILGREPAALERQALGDNFIPFHRIGDYVEGNHETGNGEIDAIVLFKIPNQGYVWACRFKGGTDYYPQDYLKKVAKPV
ncbi:hypothetical protein Hena1_02310 [Erwinia phage Hena1]|uniref:Uncharacterized protein n=1 Tax=Erwinia phage Hena1 TaxID=2678601 RepID=A0A6B9J5Y5_9CAUD|nr:tail protein [Erwinia phage Hena1]QGZ16381.1 hypothetical protein Hena1_02310 [Erwinia phage Hena1]